MLDQGYERDYLCRHQRCCLASTRLSILSAHSPSFKYQEKLMGRGSVFGATGAQQMLELGAASICTLEPRQGLV